MSTTTSTPVAQAPARTYRERLQMKQGEQFYMIIRWVIFVIAVAISMVVFEHALWPVSLESDLAVLSLYGYAAFCLIMTLAFFIPPMHALLNPASFLDILFIALLIFANGEQGAILFPLYLIPIIGISLGSGVVAGSTGGVLATASYVGAIFAGQMMAGDGSLQLETSDYAALGLQGAVLCFAPWMMSSLSEKWGATNRRAVTAAQEAANQQVAQSQQAAWAAQKQMQTLFQVASTLTTSLQGDKVLETLLNEGTNLVNYKVALALNPTGKPGELSVTAGYGLGLVDESKVLSVGQESGLVSALYPPAEPQIIDDISQVTELQEISALHNCKAACLIPLYATVNIYGLVLFARDHATEFEMTEIEILSALMNYATVALINRELAVEVKKEKMVLATAQDHARHWLAREIHDNLAQKLAAITMNLDFLKRMVKQDPSGAIVELDKLADLFKRANFDVRTLLGELKPTILETQGLPAAMEEYLKRLRTRHEGIQFPLELKGVSGLTLSNEAKSTLFNIIQESINNALKYSEAKTIGLRMEREGYRLTITIQDDGKGFNVDESKAKAKARGSYGLSNLEDRAKLIEGVTEIRSTPGKGTTIRVTVPLEV